METITSPLASFAASSYRVSSVGHFHRWLAATPAGSLAWDGGGSLALDPGQRYLVVVAAVCDGWCAVFDSVRNVLIPCQIG